MEFDELFREVRASAARLGADADSLIDRQAREPSRLPGWSRGHVLTHLARSTDAYRWMLALARTGTAPGPRADAAELERQLGEGAGRSAAALAAEGAVLAK
ncbi:maleylpyruvate isomerase N-terminal domain-containing protein, partial [Kitasatospora aureofaciens]